MGHSRRLEQLQSVDAMTDQLDAVLGQLGVRFRVFFAGSLCRVIDFDAEEGSGHLHLLRTGELTLHGPSGSSDRLTEPSLVYFPQPSGHRIEVDDERGVELVCASAKCHAPFAQALMRALPEVVVVRLREVPRLDGVLRVMFEEAFENGAGPSAVLDRLCEVVLIGLVRWALDRKLLCSGVVAGMADVRLSRALTAIHSGPARQWRLSELADEAGLSRARFAAQFSEVVGQSPFEYLSAWRIGIAQELLSRGRQLKSIADECGYSSANALSRAFVHHVGMRPSEWLARRRLRTGGRPSAREVAERQSDDGQQHPTRKRTQRLNSQHVPAYRPGNDRTECLDLA